MASPRTVTFFVYNEATGAPLTGQAGSMAFETYKDEAGADVAQPAISEVGGGAYKFTPVLTANKHINFVIDCASPSNPRRVNGNIRAEDYNLDLVDVASTVLQSAIAALQADTTLLYKLNFNRMKVWTSGPDANRMVFYDDDETTVLLKIDLKDSAGVATYTNPFERVPV